MTLTPTEIFGFIALWLFILILLAVLAARLNGIQNRMAGLSSVEAKVDLLLKQAKISFEPYANVPREVADAIQEGQEIKAIALYRQATGVGLKEAKDFVEEVERRASVR